jgi:hypothetical protein
MSTNASRHGMAALAMLAVCLTSGPAGAGVASSPSDRAAAAVSALSEPLKDKGVGQHRPGGGKAKVASPRWKPYGQSYAEWAAEWWQWALQLPASANPVLDQTGEVCMAGQHGKVWFLAGELTGSGVTVERTCNVPPGTALLVPLISYAYFGFLDDPPEQRTERFVRQHTRCDWERAKLRLEVDGRPVRNLRHFFEKSIIFAVELPEDNAFDAVFGIDLPAMPLYPSADAGFYVLLEPLARGEHTIKWQAEVSNCVSLGGPPTTLRQDVTYHLTVDDFALLRQRR